MRPVLLLFALSTICGATKAAQVSDLETALAKEDSATIRRLVAMGDASFAELKPLCGSKDERVRKSLIYVVSVIDTKAADAFLLPFLDDKNDDVVALAVETLLYLRRPKMFGIHGEPLDYQLLNQVVTPIVSLGKRAIPGLVRALSDIPPVRFLAAKTFGLLHSPAIIEPLLKNFDKLKDYALLEGALALSEFTDKRITSASD